MYKQNNVKELSRFCKMLSQTYRSLSRARTIRHIENIRNGWVYRLQNEFKHVPEQWYVRMTLKELYEAIREKEHELEERLFMQGLRQNLSAKKLERIKKGDEILKSIL